MIKVIGAIAALALGGTAVFFALKKRKNSFKVTNIDVTDSTLTFDDLIGYYKSLKLSKGEDTPFLANGNGEKIRKIIGEQNFPHKEGYAPIFAGVFRGKEIIDHKLIYAKDIDEKIKELLKDNDLVALE